MENWRKVFAKSEKFTDKFKPFKTKNKQEIPNRAEFSGDKQPSSGDSAKKELDAWKASDKLSKKDRKTEQTSCDSAVMNEKTKREDWKSQKTSNWRNTLLKKTAEVSFKQKTDGEVNIEVSTAPNTSITTPVQEPTIPPLEGDEELTEGDSMPSATTAGLEDEKLKGGKGDNRPDEDFNKREFIKGLKVEKEHTSDPAVAKEIVKDHLTEMPDDYYTELNKMESSKKGGWRNLIEKKGSAADEDPSAVGGAAWVDIAAGNLTDEQSIINSILNKAEEEGVELSLNDAKQRYLRWRSWKKRQASLNKEAWQMIPEATITDLVSKVLDANSDSDENIRISEIVRQVMNLGRKERIKGFENYSKVSDAVRNELNTRGWEISRIASQKTAWQVPEKKSKAAYPEAHRMAKVIDEYFDRLLQPENYEDEDIDGAYSPGYIDPMTSGYRVNTAWPKEFRRNPEEAVNFIQQKLNENGWGEAKARTGTGSSSDRMFIMIPYTMKKSSKLNWRNKLAGAEPDIHFKRKPDGTFTLDVTQPVNSPAEPNLPVLNTQPPATPQPEQPQEGIAPTSSQKNECTETPKKEWIIKEAKASDDKTYQLIGRECDKFCGIFIERKVVGVLPKAASKLTKSNIIDFEKVDRIGDTWQENINVSTWLSKFDSYINSIK